VKLCVFDFDATLMDGETIDFLAKELGIEEKISKITHKTMAGELDFFGSLTSRVEFLKGLELKRVDEICSDLPLMKGAKECVTELKNMGYRVVVFSGGFKNGTTPAKIKLGLDADFSNTLHSVDGILSGKVGGEMMFDDSKGEMLKRLQALLGISEADTIAVGDGANDRSMFKYAAKRVAFNAKEVLKKEANIIVDEKDLTKILDFIKA
jgi:phosphoserine phosphatase